MKRKDMDPKYQWDFTHIYPDKAAWENAMAEAEAAIAGLAALPGTLKKSKKGLKAGLDAAYAAMEKIELPFIYANLHKCADGSEPDHQTMDARAMTLMVKGMSMLAFLNPEILSIPEADLAAWMAEDDMAVYRHIVSDITRGRAHILDEAREKMLAMLGEAAQTPSNAYSMLTNVNMKLPMVHDEAGNEVQLTQGNFGVFRESRDRKVREEAFRAMFGAYRQFGDTFAALYGGAVKMDNYNATVRGYGSACEAALDGGNVPVSVYDSLRNGTWHP